MRLSLTRNISRIIIYLGLLVLLLSLVVLSGNYGKSNPSSKFSPIKIQGTQTQNSDQVASETDSSEGDENSENTSQNTNSLDTRIRVSVSSNTTNNETTGSANVEFTENGETQTFEEGFGENFDNDSFRIKVNEGEVDFDFDFDQDTKNKSSFEQRVKIKNESD